MAALAGRVVPRGIRYLDVPVSGTSDQVRRGDGVALIGGDIAIAEEVKDVLDALFVRRFHVGKIGDGGRAKLAVNLILGLNRLALAEGSGLRRAAGPRSGRVSRGGARFGLLFTGDGNQRAENGAWRFFAGGPRQADIERRAPDARPGRRCRADAFDARVHADVLEACVRAGEADLDNSAVIKEVRRRRENIEPPIGAEGGRK